MGLLDSVLGAVKSQTGQDPTALAGILQSVLANHGGLEGLAELFKKHGLGHTFDQWVGNGPNPPVTGEQVHNVIGSDQLNQLAAKFGLDATQVSNLLAHFLPSLVDKMTPHGKIEPGTNWQDALQGLIKGELSKLLAGFKF